MGLSNSLMGSLNLPTGESRTTTVPQELERQPEERKWDFTVVHTEGGSRGSYEMGKWCKRQIRLKLRYKNTNIPCEDQCGAYADDEQQLSRTKIRKSLFFPDREFY